MPSSPLQARLGQRLCLQDGALAPEAAGGAGGARAARCPPPRQAVGPSPDSSHTSPSTPSTPTLFPHLDSSPRGTPRQVDGKDVHGERGKLHNVKDIRKELDARGLDTEGKRPVT